MKRMILLLIITGLVFVVSACGGGDTPSFLGYSVEVGSVTKHENRKSIKSKGSSDKKSDAESESKQPSDVESTDVFKSTIISNSMYANKDEHLALTLRFENEKRDTLIDIVLDDSDYGNDQAYTSSSRINIIYSIETFKLEDVWITDITLVMPKTKSEVGEKRIIKIKEVNFLREVINKSVSANFRKCESQLLEVQVIEEYVPSSKILFRYDDFEAFGDTGLIITGINLEYYHNTVYIPEEIDGKKVIAIGYMILPDKHLQNLIYPSNLKYFHDRALSACVLGDFICLSQELTNLGVGDNWFQGKGPSTNLYIYKSIEPMFSSWFHDKTINPNGNSFFLDDLEKLPVL